MSRKQSKLANTAKEIWHDLYYRLGGDKGAKFALTCEDVTGAIDLGQLPKSKWRRARIRLHLSLCRMCSQYLEMSRVIRVALKTSVDDAGWAGVLRNEPRLRKDLIARLARSK